MIVSWKDKKKRIERLIDLISSHHGGDEESFLVEYKNDVIDKYKLNLDEAVACFEDLWKGCGGDLSAADKDSKKVYTHKLHCGQCGYRPVFCICAREAKDYSKFNPDLLT